MSKTTIIDGNSIGHSANYATKLTVGEQQTQAVFGFLRSMRDIMVAYDRHTPIVLWDGRAQWRFDAYPEYKSNRESDPAKIANRESYATQRPFIQRGLEALGVRQMTVMTHEADDMAGYLVSTLTQNPDNEVVLITGDEDWIQLLRRNVTWRDWRDDKKIITLDTLMDKTGYSSPYAFLEGKCLQGDTSDVISPVGGIGEKGAPEFLAEFGSVREFWRQCESGEFVPTKKAHLNLWKGTCPLTKEEWEETFIGDKSDTKALKKHMANWPGQGRLIFARNLKLMQLLKVPAPNKDDVIVKPGVFNKDKFIELCEELAFQSILRNIDTFTAPFTRRLA